MFLPHQDFFFGTFFPALRALDSPIAMACFLLVTFFPLPLFNFPFFLARISVATLFPALLEYFRVDFFLPEDFFFEVFLVAIFPPRGFRCRFPRLHCLSNRMKPANGEEQNAEQSDSDGRPGNIVGGLAALQLTRPGHPAFQMRRPPQTS